MPPVSLSAFVSDLAAEAGALVRARVDTPHAVERKGPRDLVTEVDRASEALVVKRIAAAYPAAGILGEEGGTYAGTSDLRFIVDPLDGTTNFAHGYPLFCVSIAAEVAGVIEAAAIDAPMLGLHFTASRGAGSFRNGAPMRVSTTRELERAMVCTGFHPANYARNGRYFAALSQRAEAVRRDGSAALDLAFVASGIFDAFWEWDLNPWDIAAGALLISEAGGTVSAIDGSPFDLDARSILVSNGHLHDAMREALGSA